MYPIPVLLRVLVSYETGTGFVLDLNWIRAGLGLDSYWIYAGYRLDLRLDSHLQYHPRAGFELALELCSCWLDLDWIPSGSKSESDWIGVGLESQVSSPRWILTCKPDSSRYKKKKEKRIHTVSSGDKSHGGIAFSHVIRESSAENAPS